MTGLFPLIPVSAQAQVRMSPTKAAAQTASQKIRITTNHNSISVSFICFVPINPDWAEDLRTAIPCCPSEGITGYVRAPIVRMNQGSKERVRWTLLQELTSPHPSRP